MRTRGAWRATTAGWRAMQQGMRRLRPPEEKPGDAKREKAISQSCRGCEDRPPGDRRAQNPARPVSVGHPSGGDLKKCVGHIEGRRSPTHLDLVDFKLTHKSGGGNADAGAVHIHHEGHQEREHQHSAPDMRKGDCDRVR